MRCIRSRPKFRRLACLALALSIPFVAAGCSKKKTVDLSTFTDQQLFEEATKLYKKKHWPEARERFRFLTRVHLQSPFRERAYLQIGETYFHEGSSAMSMAADAYKEFLRLYPNSPDAPYALMQLGELYFRRSKKPQRTQENTLKSIQFYNQVLTKYPNSEYTKSAADRVATAYRRLSEHELRISKFYYRKHNYKGALWRLNYIFEHYPEPNISPEAFILMAKTLKKFGRLDEAMDYLRKLESGHPKSKWVRTAEKMRTAMETIKREEPGGEPSKKDGSDMPRSTARYNSHQPTAVQREDYHGSS